MGTFYVAVIVILSATGQPEIVFNSPNPHQTKEACQYDVALMEKVVKDDGKDAIGFCVSANKFSDL